MRRAHREPATDVGELSELVVCAQEGQGGGFGAADATYVFVGMNTTPLGRRRAQCTSVPTSEPSKLTRNKSVASRLLEEDRQKSLACWGTVKRSSATDCGAGGWRRPRGGIGAHKYPAGRGRAPKSLASNGRVPGSVKKLESRRASIVMQPALEQRAPQPKNKMEEGVGSERNEKGRGGAG